MSEYKVCEYCKYKNNDVKKFPCSECDNKSHWKEIGDGCEFCEYEKRIHKGRTLSRYTDNYVGIDVYIDSNKKLNIDSCNENNSGCSCYQDIEIKIRYCPMCGAKL